MNNLEKLAAMGCGNEILNSVVERSEIHAAISNCDTFRKYYVKAVKSGLYQKEDAVSCLMKYYNKLLSVEWLAQKYSFLWQEKFSKCKLLTEKFIDSKN